MRSPAVLLVALAVMPIAASAQAWSYPSFQPPRLTVREYNFGMADAGRAGTSLLFQWRDQTGPRQQISFDLGIADPDVGSNLIIFGGIQGATQIATASSEVPLDFLLTGGIYVATGDHSWFRIPVGMSIGKRFELDEAMSLTPYVHPRISLDLCSNCGGGSDVGVSFDVGASFELSRTLSVRASALFTGSRSFDDEGFGVSIAWTPPSLVRKRY